MLTFGSVKQGLNSQSAIFVRFLVVGFPCARFFLFVVTSRDTFQRVDLSGFANFGVFFFVFFFQGFICFFFVVFFLVFLFHMFMF